LLQALVRICDFMEDSAINTTFLEGEHDVS
jgi:hypothetical protein